jgi:hypothetical protein
VADCKFVILLVIISGYWIGLAAIFNFFSHYHQKRTKDGYMVNIQRCTAPLRPAPNPESAPQPAPLTTALSLSLSVCLAMQVRGAIAAAVAEIPGPV